MKNSRRWPSTRVEVTHARTGTSTSPDLHLDASQPTPSTTPLHHLSNHLSSNNTMAFYLAIVSPLDTPLFELQFSSSKPAAPSSATSTTFPSWSTFHNGPHSTSTSTLASTANGPPAEAAGAGMGVPSNLNLGLVGGGPAGERHMLQMIAHAALDTVEEMAEGTGSL